VSRSVEVVVAVDRKARTDLRDALISYLRGEIRTFEFDDRNSAYFEQRLTEDQSVRDVSRILWTMHDDFIDHPVSVTAEGWQFLKRVVAFLGTDLELPPAGRGKHFSLFWPFHNESDWLANETAGPDPRIPEYDPKIHGRRFQPWRNRIPTVVGIAVILSAIVLMVLFFNLTGRS
jgi:hypothetical protein